MTEGGRLVVLTSADSYELTASLITSLAEWCEAGLLGSVAWAPASELAAAGGDAPCHVNIDGEWRQATLRQAMERQPLAELWLAVLRHPQGHGIGSDVVEARRTEEAAHEAVGALLAAGITFRSCSVSIAGKGRQITIADCAPVWDFHLVHDLVAMAHSSAPVEAAERKAPLELCAMVALGAGGGWRGSQPQLDLPSDRTDGPVKPVRFVHCQFRVLQAPSLASFAVPTSLPTAAPWPLPHESGVQRALPSTVPSLVVAESLAKACGFLCKPSPYRPNSDSRWVFTRWWRGLLRPIPKPAPPSEYEQALLRLAERTGGVKPQNYNQELSELVLQGAADLTGLVYHVRRSDFPLPSGSSGVAPSSQETWQTLRSAMFGLVDGSTMPSGIPHPSKGTGNDAVRLVWTDPTALAPRWAPANAADILLDAAAPLEDYFPEDYWPENEEKLGEENDVLMTRMTGYIRQAIRSAKRGFVENAVLRSVGKEYSQAVRAQRAVRFVIAGMGVLLALICVFALDQRWPFLGNAWEFITRTQARRTYDPLIWPVGWFVVAGLVLAVGAILIAYASWWLLVNLRRLEEGNTQRARFGFNASYYASEMLRLNMVTEQFVDHRLIITEFLHRPFGRKKHGEEDGLTASAMQCTEPPPPVMLVACAEADPAEVDARHRQHYGEVIEQGWLTGVYQDVLATWHEKYRQRILGDYDDPDNDTSSPGLVFQKDRHDGSDVFGARFDFTESVVGSERDWEGGWVVSFDGTVELPTDEDNERDGRSGWAVRSAYEERLKRLIESSSGGVDDILKLLLPLERVYGAFGSIGHDAAQFLDLNGLSHWFHWNDLLSPGANAPDILEPVICEPWLVSQTVGGRSLVLAARLDISEPLRPQDQVGWQGSGEGRSADVSTRQVV
ncbi:MAG: hypothetical protein OXE93_02205 [bacterium]|nr:hypothetical protein [bacterium]